MFSNCRKLSMVFFRHHVHGTPKLQNFLLSIGFIISKSDSSLFIHRQKELTVFLLVYVDDIIITGTSFQQVQRFITTSAHRFCLKDLDHLAYFFRVEAIHTSSNLFLSQYKYICDLLEKHNMLGANAISTPISSTMPLKLHDGAPLADPIKYRQTLIGRENSDDCTSTSTYVVFLGCNPISWSFKKQKIVARSYTEVEYRVVATTTVEINWVQNLLYELQAQSPSTPTIYYDNVGATYVCTNTVFHSRMKHIAIDFPFVRDQVPKSCYMFLIFILLTNSLTLSQSPYLAFSFKSLFQDWHPRWKLNLAGA
ncbi:Retrovirus-related Pol polyprotein from transposon RE2 [Vitis vinifera]|uniref:Retrovirus-related Pol polyprotein from transposon RE2 n=1 Tax=Vitis vinifera TaxID=29760 RepID=A0A438DS57_VITVI|nr:Retrovirus-related Pol polyprotein from transposon RE2 [Vitis vinifera]